MEKSPDRLYISVRSSKAKSFDELINEKEILAVIEKEKELEIDAVELTVDALIVAADQTADECMFTRQEYLEAEEIYKSKKKKKYLPFILESMLLATKDHSKIAESMGLKNKVVEIYSKIFYYVNDLSYISKFDLIQNDDELEKDIKLKALRFGTSFICAFYLNEAFKVHDILSHMELVLAEEFFQSEDSDVSYRKLLEIYNLLKKNASAESENNKIHRIAIEVLKESYSDIEGSDNG